MNNNTAASAIGDACTAGTLIDTAAVPGGGWLQLIRHGDDFEILLDTEQLMGSWDSGSEKALASLVCQRLRPGADRVLIGGLGMGFTLAAACSALSPHTSIVVAELVPQVLEWAGSHLAHIFDGSLDDPRVSVEIRDVHDLISEQRNWFDAILLDVDNGPEGLVTLANERLYCNWGLRAAYAALRPSGILAVWSAFPDAEFAARLRHAGFAVEEVKIRSERGEPDPSYVIWLAAKQENVTSPATAFCD